MLTACAVMCGMSPSMEALAQTAQVNTGIQLAQAGITTTPNATPTVEPRSGTKGKAITPNVSADAPETIIVKAQRRLLKEKNSPHLGSNP